MRFTARAATSLSILAVLAGSAQADAAAGELDRSFGAGGKTIRDLGGTDYVADVTATSGLATLALVRLERRGDEAVGVMRLAGDGRLDRSFGRNGLAVVSLAGDEQPGGIALTATGRIVVSFTSDRHSADGAFGVARFREGGKPDSTFDRDGVQTTGFGTGFSYATASDVAVDDGRITVAGGIYNGAASDDDFALARFDRDGELDDSFSGDGRQTTDFNGESDFASAVAIDSQGRAVVVGTADRYLSVDPLAIARYDTNGELDGSFSGDGRLVSTAAPDGSDVLVAPGDAIVAAGTVSGDFMAARFTESGDPDASFSEDGVQTVDFVDGADRLAAIAASGRRLVLAGTARTGRRGRDFAVARLTPGGELDESFSDDGRRAVDIAKGDDDAFAVTVHRRSSIVAAGWSERGEGEDSSLIRLYGRGRR